MLARSGRLTFVCALMTISIYGLINNGLSDGALLAAPVDEAFKKQQQVDQFQKQKSDALLNELSKTKKQPPKQGAKKPQEVLAEGSVTPRRNRVGKVVCFPVDHILIEGNTLLSDGKVDEITAPFAKSCVGLKEIAYLIRTLTASYLSKGYITSRIYIPEQNIKKSRRLKLAVVEGQTEAIGFTKAEDGTERQVAMAFPSLVGKSLNLRDLEQGIDQLNRLSSNNVTLKIAPGNKPGQSIVQLANDPSKRWGVSVRSDNLGQDYTGRYKGSISPYINNLLGLNDHLSFGYERSGNHRPFRVRDRKQFGESFSGAISIPYGYWTAYLDGSFYQYKSFVPAGFSDVPTEGVSEQLRFTLDRVIHRDQVSKTSLSGSLTYKENENLILGSRIETGSRALTIANLGLIHVRAMMGGSWAFSLNYERGLTWFGALDDRDTPKSEPEAQFDKFSASVSLQRPFKIGDLQFIYSGLISGQYSDDELFGSEQISHGGYYSIRGFRESVIFGNNGLFGRNELELYLPAIPDADQREIFGQFSLFGALDVGRIYGQEDFGITTETISGWSAGVRSAYGKVDFELAVSKALQTQDEIEDETLLYARGGVKF